MSGLDYTELLYKLMARVYPLEGAAAIQEYKLERAEALVKQRQAEHDDCERGGDSWVAWPHQYAAAIEIRKRLLEEAKDLVEVLRLEKGE